MNTTQDDGGSAFPVAPTHNPDGTVWYHGKDGMSLRDWLTGMALQGLLANPGGPIQANGMSGWDFTNCTPEQVSQQAVGMADVTLAALKGKEAK